MWSAADSLSSAAKADEWELVEPNPYSSESPSDFDRDQLWINVEEETLIFNHQFSETIGTSDVAESSLNIDEICLPSHKSKKEPPRKVC
jgi:hypothetical protein